MPVSTTWMPASARIVSNRAVLAVPVVDEVPHPAAGVLEVHDEVVGGLGHPRCGRMRGRAEDPDAAAGVLDDGEDVHLGLLLASRYG